MTPERAREVERICTAALDREPAARATFVDAECAGDDALRLDVASLLAREGDADGFLCVPALELAAQGVAADGGRLAIGKHLGCYRMLSLIGAGGMGEVYRARDTILQRDVAIKVLPTVFSHDADRLTRFEREAHILASLNHPHIAAIYGLVDEGGVRALVLELVEGESLADRLARGPLPLNEAIAVADQIADALAAAHDGGVVHRDLKPANVKLTGDGLVKVLDFGLAKAIDRVASDAGPPARPDTRGDAILGTPGYMSPEQARGRPTDKRSDIWAFGCVLYEMLTGAAAMAGATSADVSAAVLGRDPDWDALPEGTPPGVRRLLARCLEKDPKRRLHDIADARIELNDLESDATTWTASRSRGSVGWFALALVTAALVIALAVVASVMAGRFAASSAPASAEMRFSISPPDLGVFSRSASDVLAISPDGTTIAFVVAMPGKRDQIWLRSLNALTPRLLPGTDRAQSPFWSADSQSIGFFADGALKMVPRAGGEPRLICQANGPRQATWSESNVILFASDSRGTGGLRRVSASGGPVTAVTTPDRTIGETGHLLPMFLPDGRHFLYSVTATDGGSIYAGSLDSTQRIRLLGPPDIHGASSLAYAPPGYLFFVRDGTLLAQPLDLGRLRLAGEPVRVAEGIQNKSVADGAAAFSVSANGVLAYVGAAADSKSRLAWFTRAGREIAIQTPLSHYGRLSLSSDDRRVAIERRDAATGPGLALVDLAGGTTTSLTSDPFSIYPVWSPDGTRIVFSSTRDGGMAPYEETVGAGEGAHQLFSLPTPTTPTDWSTDGRVILYQTGNYPKGDIGAFPLGGRGVPRPLVHTDAGRADGHLSPDGRWLAYVSEESGVSNVYVTSFPEERGRWPISIRGGREPRWRYDGHELYYLSLDQRVMAVSVSTSPTFHAGAPLALFGIAVSNYAPARDGRFLLVVPTIPAESALITVVVNWPAALAKK